MALRIPEGVWAGGNAGDDAAEKGPVRGRVARPMTVLGVSPTEGLLAVRLPAHCFEIEGRWQGALGDRGKHRRGWRARSVENLRDPGPGLSGRAKGGMANSSAAPA